MYQDVTRQSIDEGVAMMSTVLCEQAGAIPLDERATTENGR